MGVGTVLDKKGYDCSFVQGAENGSWKFDRFSNVAGYQHYYGRTEYNNEKDYDGAWGIFDEPFMQFAARTVDAKQKPFLATLFTLSSHHPYILPEKYKGKFQKGTDTIYEMIYYTDNALRNFFNTASNMD
mgnify:FL=1